MSCWMPFLATSKALIHQLSLMLWAMNLDMSQDSSQKQEPSTEDDHDIDEPPVSPLESSTGCVAGIAMLLEAVVLPQGQASHKQKKELGKKERRK